MFETSLMGSLPRSKDLLTARRKWLAGMIDRSAYDQLVESETEKAIRFQEELGLDVITSGELGRDNYVSFISEKLGGVAEMSMAEMMEYVEDKKEFENILNILDVPATSIKNAICVDKLTYKGDIVADELRLVKKYTDKPVKVTLPGPYLVTRSMWLADVSAKAYVSKEALGEDVIAIYTQEIRQLLEIGVHTIQFDEPVLTEIVFTDGRPRTFMCASLSERKDPTEELLFATHLIKSVVDAIPETETTIALHVCRGNWSKKEEIMLEGPYTPLIDLFSKIGVDQLTLEFSTPRAGELSSLLSDPRIQNKVNLGLGVINPRSDTIESVAEMVEKAHQALAFIEADRLSLNPDCGFATFANRPVNIYEHIADKVANMVKAAAQLRAEYHG